MSSVFVVCAIAGGVVMILLLSLYIGYQFCVQMRLSSLPSLRPLAPLKNKYFGVRHGESEANIQHILMSDPAISVTGCGLTQTGKLQAAEAARKLSSLVAKDDSLIIVASDFHRAQQTANIIHAQLQVKTPVVTHKALRERGFGVLNKAYYLRYIPVWIYDGIDPFHSKWSVESVASIYRRTVEVIHYCEANYSDSTIVFVSHGDTLQVMQVAFQILTPAKYRSLALLSNGYVAHLSLN